MMRGSSDDSGGRAVRVAVAVLLLLGMVAAPSRADDNGPACGTSPGETWEGSDSCHLLIGGVPVTAYGTASRADGGEARVHVRVYVKLPRTEELHLLTECEDSGPGEASCSAQLGPDQEARIPGNVAASGLCVVDGQGVGTYWCETGLGF